MRIKFSGLPWFYAADFCEQGKTTMTTLTDQAGVLAKTLQPQDGKFAFGFNTLQSIYGFLSKIAALGDGEGLTDEQIGNLPLEIYDACGLNINQESDERIVVALERFISQKCRAIESAATLPLRARIAELEAKKQRSLDRYMEFKCDEEESDPVERLRFFCSLAMEGHDSDWLDVERFFDEVLEERKKLQEQLAASQAREKELLDALVVVLPYLETAETDPLYKPGAVRKVTSLVEALVKAKPADHTAINEARAQAVEMVISQASWPSMADDVVRAIAKRIRKGEL